MNLQNKLDTVSQLYARFGLRGLSLKMAVAHVDGIDNHLLSMWGFERCTVENNVEMIYLSASEVEYIDSFGFIPQKGKNAVAGIAGGSWDLLRRPFKESSVHRSLYEVIVNGSDWCQTPKYQSAYSRIQSGKRSWRCGSVNELNDRVDTLETIYKSIRDDGFKTQLELYNSEGRDKSNYQKRMGDLLVPNELRVAIGRGGEVIRTTHGLHRTSIMKILDRDTPIPAIIQFKHEDFEEDLPYKKVSLDDTHDLVDYSAL